MVFLLMGGAYLRSRIKQAGKWDQETIVSFFLCQYCSGEYLPLKYIGWMQEDQESHTAIYAKGVGYDWSTQMTPVAGSTFDKVFVSCTDLDDNKVSCADQL